MSLTKRTSLLTAESAENFILPMASRSELHENLGYLLLDSTTQSSATFAEFTYSRGPLLHHADTALMEQLVQQNHQDSKRIAFLEDEIAELKEVVSDLKSHIDDNEAVNLRKISKSAAKREIKQYFDSHVGETFYPSDIAEALNIDYDIASAAMDALEKSGDIELS